MTRRKVPKKCDICERIFYAPFGSVKYCPDCAKEKKDETAKEYRKKHKFLKIKNIAELQNKEAFKRIINYYFERIKLEKPSSNDYYQPITENCPGASFDELLKISGKSETQLRILLKTCLKLEAMTHKDNMYYLTSKCIYEPLRERHRRTIDETPAERIYLGEHFVFYLPENILSADFERNDMMQINKIHEDFSISIRKLMEKIRKQKAGEIWTKEIIDNDYVNPVIKLNMWTRGFVNTICTHSSKIFLSFYQKMLDTNKGKMPRDKAIELWKKQEDYFVGEIFNYLLHNLFWREKNISEEEVKQLNQLFKKKFSENYQYCSEVFKRIAYTLQQKDFTLIISPFIERGFGYKLKSKDENIEYLKSIPWFEYRCEADDRLMDALNYVYSLEKQHKLIERREIESAGIKIPIEYKITEREKKSFLIPFDSSPVESGKIWLNNFNFNLRKEFLEFCTDLGYKNEQQVYERIGEFVEIFSLPHVPSFEELLAKS